MKVFINDKETECREGATLREALEANGTDTAHMAAAVNFTVIPKEEWDSTQLKEGNKIIIIKAAQGG